MSFNPLSVELTDDGIRLVPSDSINPCGPEVVFFQYQTIGLLNDELLISNQIGETSWKFYRFSLIERKIIGFYQISNYDTSVMMNFYKDPLHLSNNRQDPDNPYLYQLSHEGELHRFALGTGESKNLKFNVQHPFVIDKEKSHLYHGSSSSGKFLIYQIDLETLSQKEFCHSDVDSDLIFIDLDPVKQILFFSDHSHDLFSYDISNEKNLPKISNPTSKIIPWGSCCVKDGILTSYVNNRYEPPLFELELNNHFGIFVSILKSFSFRIDTKIFDRRTGYFISMHGNEIMIINPDFWFPSSPEWSVERHHHVNVKLQKIVKTFTETRTLCLENIISLLPNELLFEIFKHL